MRINFILNRLNLNKVETNHVVSLITDDSTECVDGSVFVAYNGHKDSGRNHIHEAIRAGAKTIVTDQIMMEIPFVNYIYVDNPKRILALMLKIFYKNISKKLNVIGVIGTNGKTTTSSIGYNFFNYVKKDAMLIGSNGIFYQGIKIKTNNTTPSITIIYNYLVKAYNLGIKYIFMEVSSIAVSELRCLGIEYKTLIYTNFSEDHLDYHKNMDAYLFAKMIPFISNDCDVILNCDDHYSKDISKYLTNKIYTYGVKNGEYKATDCMVSDKGLSFKYNSFLFVSKMLGSFNIYNILAILPLCDIFNINKNLYVKFLKEFNGVDGRMNVINYHNNMIIIDYAHTEEAVKRVVYDVLNICKNNLYIVIGCGGNREKEKRDKIGTFLDSFGDKCIITTDNPRFEEPLDIIKDITKNMTNNPTIIENRKDAIIYGLDKLENNDCLLILGKGAEDYIDVKGAKYKYLDMEVCNEWINKQ